MIVLSLIVIGLGGHNVHKSGKAPDGGTLRLVFGVFFMCLGLLFFTICLQDFLI